MIENAQTPIQKTLFNEFKEKVPDFFEDRNKQKHSLEELQTAIASIVNPLLTKGHSFYSINLYLHENGQNKNEELLETPSLDRFTKVMLEYNFSNCIAPRKAIEFADRMYTVTETVESVPKDFSGLIDLTVCNSVVLGQAIKLSRLKCLVAVNRYQTEPVPRIRMYLQVIKSIYKKPESFIDVLTRLLK